MGKDRTLVREKVAPDPEVKILLNSPHLPTGRSGVPFSSLSYNSFPSGRNDLTRKGW